MALNCRAFLYSTKGETNMTVLDSVLLEEYERKKKMKIAFKKELEDNPKSEHIEQMKNLLLKLTSTN